MWSDYYITYKCNDRAYSIDDLRQLTMSITMSEDFTKLIKIKSSKYKPVEKSNIETELIELADVSEGSRNNSLFSSLNKIANSDRSYYQNIDNVYSVVAFLNNSFKKPLPDREIRAISKSISKYSAKLVKNSENRKKYVKAQ